MIKQKKEETYIIYTIHKKTKSEFRQIVKRHHKRETMNENQSEL